MLNFFLMKASLNYQLSIFMTNSMVHASSSFFLSAKSMFRLNIIIIFNFSSTFFGHPDHILLICFKFMQSHSFILLQCLENEVIKHENILEELKQITTDICIQVISIFVLKTLLDNTTLIAD